MNQPKEAIVFDHKGIGLALAHHRLSVPLNQREYSWEEDHVKDLLSDLKAAISRNVGTYFLGSIVLTRGSEGGTLEVTDGQQRLATTTILLAAIRDYFLEIGRAGKADALEKRFLLSTDYDTEEVVPQLRLNVDDHEFFAARILERPESPRRNVEPSKESHERIDAAARLAAEHVREVAAYYGQGSLEQLTEWVRFLENGAQVILLTVPDHLNAFLMFETLNDRGLRASQADLLKNHILSLAGDRIREAQQKWAHMLGTLETTGIEEIAVTYLRHLIITMHGPTKERELFGRVKETVNSKPSALAFADALADSAAEYASLFNPEHVKWNEYGKTTRGHVRTLLELGVEQIRPLLFAVAKHFDVDEGQKAFKLFVSWSVRFLIAGGRGGVLDRHYSFRAHEIGTGAIETARQLAEAMRDVVPSDAVFQAAFADARVSRGYLARYYLRALEQAYTGQAEPEFVPNDNEMEINLEHVLPANPDGTWGDIHPDAAAALHRRVGNMVLLQATRNSKLGNRPFSEKKSTLLSSGFDLTRKVGESDVWDESAIIERQKQLAELAVRTWPIDLA